MQHEVLTGLFDNKLVFPPVELAEGDHVLDSATGSGLSFPSLTTPGLMNGVYAGVWMVDVAHKYPSVTFTGTDISAHLFRKEVPPNVSYTVESVLAMPAAWSGKFTLTNQRLLIVGLKEPQWPPALGELFRVTKPGGWVQLSEYTHTLVSGPVTARFLGALREMVGTLGFMLDMGYHLKGLLGDAGFVDVEEKQVKGPLGNWDPVGKEHGFTMLEVFHGLKVRRPVGEYWNLMLRRLLSQAAFVKGGGYGLLQTAEEYDTLMEEMKKEWDTTPGTYTVFVSAWGRKPVS